MSNKHWIKGMRRRAKAAARSVVEQAAIRELVDGKPKRKSSARQQQEAAIKVVAKQKRRESALDREARFERERKQKAAQKRRAR